MLEVGTRVVHKASGRKGHISDAWNPYYTNPRVFRKDTPTGYEITTDDGMCHICSEDDFEVICSNSNRYDDFNIF